MCPGGLCVSLLLDGRELPKIRPQAGDFANRLFLTRLNCLYICLPQLVVLDQCLAEHGCASLRVSTVGLGS